MTGWRETKALPTVSILKVLKHYSGAHMNTDAGFAFCKFILFILEINRSLPTALFFYTKLKRLQLFKLDKSSGHLPKLVVFSTKFTVCVNGENFILKKNIHLSDLWNLTLTSDKLLNTVLHRTKTVNFVSHHLHWRHVRKGPRYVQYEQEEWSQQAKAVSMFMWLLCVSLLSIL